MEEILHHAEQSEKEYDWLGATESYENVLNLLPQDEFSKVGEIHERLGYAFYRFAFQAENKDEFRERLRQSTVAYEKAGEFYGKLNDKQRLRMFRCKAVIKYLGHWLTPIPSEKRKLLDECLEFEDKALEAFSESGDMLEYGKTYNELSRAFFCRFFLEWDRQTGENIVKRGVEWGEKAVAGLSELVNSYQIARAHFTLATCLTLLGWNFIAEPEVIEQNRLKVVKILSKTAESSEKLGDAYLSGSSHLWWGANAGGEEAKEHYERFLECGKLARDNFLIAWGLDFLAWSTYWKAIATEDLEERRKMAEKAMQFYDKAQHYYSVILYASPRSGVIAPPTGYAEYYLHLAGWETDSSKRLEFLEKSEKAGIEALKEAEASDIPNIVQSAVHVVSKIFEARAYIELDPVEKRSYLEKALKYREKAIEILDQLTPFNYWDRGVMQNYLAEIKWLLAEIEPNLDSRRRLLEEAVISKERCIELCDKMAPYFERTGDISFFAALRNYQDTYVTILTRLYDLTNNPENLRKAIEISQKAIESASKLDVISRIADSYWKIATAQDMLGEHLKAAESFKHSSEGYMKASEKIPQLKGFYQDYAGYMCAWSEIEKARHHHVEKQYGLAREHYVKTADMHDATQRWNYLGQNYRAWARLEEAEDLSRKEQIEEAKDLFQQAADLFAEAKKSIQTKLEKIENKDEKEMSISLAKASDVRREYCLGRIALEEAKILDRQGNHTSSSRKYGFAAENFQKAINAIEHEPDHQELKPIVFLCQAWQMMTRAEAEASPDLYKEASQLFEEAKDHSLDEKAKMLALGHSRFCKALEAGTRFADTRDVKLHGEAQRYLESAANYYVKAGFPKVSEYAEATGLLFDAYVHMDEAKKEKDPERKTKLYAMAERVLQTSAGSFMRAEHPEKREQVLGLLEKVKKEQELALSLTELLHAPSIVSTTTSFTTPAPSREEAVGSERFEHADVQANLIVRQKELKIGENLNIELELVNAGKGSALLTKVTEIIPKDFELVENPQIYRVEDSYLNLKGKRLDPLKTEEVKLVLKPTVQGTFSLKPTVLYLDETGKYKSHEPEPVIIVVKELGIKGWLKGER